MPSDNFNAITVAASQPAISGAGGLYDRFDFGNAVPGPSSDALGTRTSIDLLAPGDEIPIINRMEQPDTFGGTSAAAPHVTGAIALLHQYAKQEIAAGNPAFDCDDSRQHQVMKAVLLNSADKLDGVHGSKRSILRTDGSTWVDGFSPSQNALQPLDSQLGAGHLNVERAVEQFSSGASGPGMVGDNGWDFRRSGGIGDQFSYTIGPAAKAGDYIAATLVWDRVVNKPDAMIDSTRAISS